MWLGIPRSARWIRICAAPASARSTSPDNPAEALRSSVPGKTAQGSSSAILRRCGRAVRRGPPAASQAKAPCRVDPAGTAKTQTLKNREQGTTMAQIANSTTELDFDREMVETAYDRWAPVYDLVFGGVFSKGRTAAIAATNKIGGRVLEVGVGTGISLPQYGPHLRIFGTDISEGMLRKAKARVAELGLRNVEGRAVM